MKLFSNMTGCGQRPDGQEGFTLVEVLVATAVSSVILLMIYSAHRSIMTAIRDLTGVADFYENINLARYRIDRDLSCCFFNKYNKKLCFIGENNYGDFRNGKIDFVTVDHNDFLMSVNVNRELHRSDIHEVGYFLKRDPATQDLYYLMRREDSHYDDDPLHGGTESVLLENVKDIKFEFSLLNNWTDKWDSRQFNKFPRAVKTTITMKNYRGNEEQMVIVSFIELVK